ncbi:MAG: hypothetical protein ACMUIE_09390 [Thermoplasmatota archaeon]
MAVYCPRCGSTLEYNFCSNCHEKVEKRTGTRLGMLFFFIAMLLFSLSFLSLSICFTQARDDGVAGIAPLILWMGSLFFAPFFYYLGAGAMLAGRNDLDGTHRWRATIGALIYILSPLLLLLFFLLGNWDAELQKETFIMISVVNSVIAAVLASANYLMTCHLTDEFYFPNGKRFTRRLIRGISIFLLAAIAFHIIGNAVLVYTIELERMEEVAMFAEKLVDFYAISTFLLSVYFFWIGIAFLSLFMGFSGRKMNEDAMNMGRSAWYSEQYRLYEESMRSYQDQYGGGYYGQVNSGSVERVEVALELPD